MLHKTFILLQIDEACRYIKDGRLAHLRIALLLLDNTAEILMDCCIENILPMENFRERIRVKALTIPPSDRTPDLQELVEWQPLTYKEKLAINRYFDEKVSYLSQNKNKIDHCFILPISHLHKYRNEAYHSAKVRKETIETAAKLYVEINCELLLKLSPEWNSYSSDVDYSWIENRFNVRPQDVFMDDNFIKKVTDDFRDQINLTDESVCKLLAEHIENRITKLYSQIDFILNNTKCPNKEVALFDSYIMADKIREQYGELKPKRIIPQQNYKLDFIDSLIIKSKEIYTLNKRVEAFRSFSKIESELEQIEIDLTTVVNEIDHIIEMESEIARGK
jgi:hypothetical protein